MTARCRNKRTSEQSGLCSDVESANSFDAPDFKSAPKTKSQPSEAVVIWKGGAAEWVRSDFWKKSEQAICSLLRRVVCRQKRCTLFAFTSTSSLEICLHYATNIRWKSYRIHFSGDLVVKRCRLVFKWWKWIVSIERFSPWIGTILLM